MSATEPAFHFNEDGSAANPAAFRAALQSDPDKLRMVQSDPKAAAVLLGEDDAALQAFLKDAFQVGGTHDSAA